MTKHYDLDEADLEYELQYAEDDSYRNSKKKKRANRAQRNWKHAWLENQGAEDFVIKGIDRRTGR